MLQTSRGRRRGQWRRSARSGPCRPCHPSGPCRPSHRSNPHHPSDRDRPSHPSARCRRWNQRPPALELFVDLGRIVDRVRDFRQEQRPTPPAQAVHGHLDRALRHLQRGCDVTVGRGVGLATQERLEVRKERPLSGIDVFPTQAVEHLIEHREGPATFEHLLRCRRVRQLLSVSAFSDLEVQKVERQGRAARTPLRCAASPLLIRDKVLQRRQQKRTELSPPGVGNTDGALLEELDEEALREILRVLTRVAPPAEIGIQGIPVCMSDTASSRPDRHRATHGRRPPAQHSSAWSRSCVGHLSPKTADHETSSVAELGSWRSSRGPEPCGATRSLVRLQ